MSEEHPDDASLAPSHFFWIDARCDRFETAWKAGR